ncbi:hypothetical protein KM043_017944 [Ampulex compressa]|nr:hypothetical protein KM043_017944 [Ampulex compressa]
MGLLLSVLVGCVGILELLACLKHASDGLVISIDPPTPCLSYHDQENDNRSTHDSLCSFSHSSDVRLPRGARHKLENLHEYSLRVRHELRSLDKSFECGTLSECSTRYLLGGSRPDSRLSPDFNFLVEDSEAREDDSDLEDEDEGIEEGGRPLESTAEARRRALRERTTLIKPQFDEYVRVPTPIPFSLDDEFSRSGTSSDEGTSFDNDSGNEAPTTRTFDSLPAVRPLKDSLLENASSDEKDELSRVESSRERFERSLGKSLDTATRSTRLESNPVERASEKKPYSPEEEQRQVDEATAGQRKTRGGKSTTTILRKPTRLKSRNAQISRSAENLSAKRSKRHREPERRKSDISVQTVSDTSRDEATNTSPPGSPIMSRSESKRSVSVEVQTSFEEKLSDDDALMELESSALGLSESKRDLTSRDRSGRRSFKNRRFGSRDKVEDEGRDVYSVTNATASVERPGGDKSRLLRISSFEEAESEDYERIRDVILDPEGRGSNGWQGRGSRSRSSFEDDEEYLDAEDVSARRGPIQYSVPDTDQNKAFWVNQLIERMPSTSLE